MPVQAWALVRVPVRALVPEPLPVWTRVQVLEVVAWALAQARAREQEVAPGPALVAEEPALVREQEPVRVLAVEVLEQARALVRVPALVPEGQLVVRVPALLWAFLRWEQEALVLPREPLEPFPYRRRSREQPRRRRGHRPAPDGYRASDTPWRCRGSSARRRSKPTLLSRCANVFAWLKNSGEEDAGLIRRPSWYFDRGRGSLFRLGRLARPINRSLCYSPPRTGAISGQEMEIAREDLAPSWRECSDYVARVTSAPHSKADARLRRHSSILARKTSLRRRGQPSIPVDEYGWHRKKSERQEEKWNANQH